MGLFQPLADTMETASGTPLSVDSSTPVTDPYTLAYGTFIPMQVLIHSRELYNAEDNPIYLPNFKPILGASGILQEHGDEIDTINSALSPTGWYTRYIKSWTYPSPMDLLFYYGWLNSFNYGTNQWNNEKVAQDFAKYSLVIFGDGIQNPGHGDYANTQIIIPRVRALNNNAQVFGYVTVNQSLANFKTKVDQWDNLHVNGIFMDEAGYDYGTTRSGLNERIDYVRTKTYANVCFVNCWNMDHIIGINNDPSYPNSTYNPNLVASHLTANDWYLLESFPVNTAAYGGGGYESKFEWAVRAVKADGHRYTYGIKLAAVSVINNSNSKGQSLFNFSFVSATMWNLDAHGSSDTNYGSSSATVTMWSRPRTEGLGREWVASPAVQVDVGDSDKYYRYVDYGRMILDFSSGSETSDIEKFTPEDSFVIRFSPADLTDGTLPAPAKTTSSGNPVTGLAYDAATEESMYGSFEVPSKWKDNTNIVVKIYYFNDYSQTDVKVCRWAIDYQTYSNLDKISDKTTTKIVVNHSLPNNVAADTFMETSLTMNYNDANNPLTRGKTVPFRIYRDCTNVADTMSNDAIMFIVSFDCEREVI